MDDFLANGEAATGAIRLLRKAHATIAGVGILIEKSFQPGRGKLIEQGIDVYSLARISKLGKDLIELFLKKNKYMPLVYIKSIKVSHMFVADFFHAMFS